MVVQYPHKLRLSIAAASSQNDSGNWESGSVSTQDIECRAEPNSKNVFLSGPEGERIKYEWDVYMPLPVEMIKSGTSGELFDQNNVTLGKGTVKRFSAGQLNARAWI
jgi:hypothetical protein